MSTFAVPGQILANASTHIPGPGTHLFENNIIASILGSVTNVPASSKANKATTSISHRNFDSQVSSALTSTSLPIVGSVVLCRVVRVQQRQLSAAILVVDPSPSSLISYTSATNDDLQFQAVLRREDIRAYEKDKIVMNEMYRVGDVIRASVISLGDERNYNIGTAGNEFGVVVAKSEAGNPMVPASWKEMKDVFTGKGESRKVGKPA